MTDLKILLKSPWVYGRLKAFRDVQERLGNSMTLEEAAVKLIEEALMVFYPECKPLSETEKRGVENQKRNSALAGRGWEGSTRLSKHVRDI